MAVNEFNIAGDSKYHWTVSNQRLARAEVPVIKLIEFQQNSSALWSSLWYWARQGNQLLSDIQNEGLVKGFQKGQDPYKSLYMADRTNNSYTFPFYNPYHHDINQGWDHNMGPIGDAINAFATPVAKVISPAGGIEPPRAWQGTPVATYNFSFTLLNTVDPINDFKNNKEFIKIFINQNLQYRINSVAAMPPCIYEVEIPGVRISPVTAVSNLNVKNVGQINNIGNMNIPDGYEVSIGLTELFSESRQIYDGVSDSSKRVTAIVSTETVLVEDKINNVESSLGKKPVAGKK